MIILGWPWPTLWQGQIIHQSFVITAATGPGNSGYFNFPWCKAPVNALHCGDIFVVKTHPKALLKSWQVNGKILQIWNQKPGRYLALRGWCWGKNMAFKPRCIPAIRSPGLPSDWCFCMEKGLNFRFYRKYWSLMTWMLVHLVDLLSTYIWVPEAKVIVWPLSKVPPIDTFKHFLLWSQISCRGFIGWKNKFFFIWSWSCDQGGCHAHIW